MTESLPYPAAFSRALQGSSGAKVLADYAAMSPASNSNVRPDSKTDTSAADAADQATPPESCDPEPCDPASKPQSRPRSWTESREIGGREGPEPTRFGDWEKAGRCIDF